MFDLFSWLFYKSGIPTAVKPGPCDITQGYVPDPRVLNFLLCSISILVLTLCRSKQMLFFLQHSGSAICLSNREGKKIRAASLSPPQMEHKELFVICQGLILIQHILLPPVTLQIDIIRRPKLCYCLNMTTPQRE